MDPLTNKAPETPADANNPSLKQIRTFQGDVAEALERQQGSLVSIQQAEHSRERSLQSEANTGASNASNKAESFFLLVGSLVLFALGTAGTWYGYQEFVRRTATPIAALPANRFVPADSEMAINTGPLARPTLLDAIFEATHAVPTGEVRHVILTKRGAEETTLLMPANEFFERLEVRAPGNLLRAFDPLFMLGATGQSVFLIIKLSSFENAFAGMLGWEENMAQDIGPLFETAPYLRNLTPEAVFTDMTDRNKDSRMLSLGNQPILIYSFFDNEMLVITDNIETLRLVLERLAREKLSR